MGIVSRLVEHLELMASMLKRTGAITSGATGFSFEPQLRQAVYRCAACRDTEACRDWLAEGHEGEPAPEFCRNAALIERLRAAW